MIYTPTTYHKRHPFILQIIEEASEYDHIVFDGFAGCGGVSEGFEEVNVGELEGTFYVIACINHDDKAIASHMANHPRCLHLLEDFRTADIALVAWMADEIRGRNPNIKFHGWFSVECTNYSNAKGGMPRDADSRTLPEDMYRYIEAMDFDVIWLENVREFLMWGPMLPKTIAAKGNKNQQLYFNIEKHNPHEFFEPYINAGIAVYCPLVVGKKNKKIKENYVGKWEIPDPELKGRDFKAWEEHIKSYGYDSDRRLMNSADYGVPQTRIRLIMQFTRRGEPAYWPDATHDKKCAKGLPRWVPVKEVLDLEDEGESVLSFKPHKLKGHVPRISSAKTILRLIKGTTKHALKSGERQFLASYYGSGGQHSSVNMAGPTLPTKDRCALASVKFMLDYNHSCSSSSINETSRTLLTKDKHFPCTVQFIDKQYNGDNANYQSIEAPAGTISINNKLALSTVHFVEQQPSTGQADKSVFLSNFQYDNEGAGIDDPSRTLLAGRKHYYIISAQFNNLGASVDNPAQTLIARMDKKPPYLVVTEFGQLAIEVYDYDPPHYRELKQFMAANGIISIKMRMLNKRELKLIQTLPEDYHLKGSDTDQKKQIGNAVPSRMVTAIARNYHMKSKASKQNLLFAA
jgi:DNA (cytosine-5)-methyltransferase 1